MCISTLFLNFITISLFKISGYSNIFYDSDLIKAEVYDPDELVYDGERMVKASELIKEEVWDPEVYKKMSYGPINQIFLTFINTGINGAICGSTALYFNASGVYSSLTEKFGIPEEIPIFTIGSLMGSFISYLGPCTIEYNVSKCMNFMGTPLFGALVGGLSSVYAVELMTAEEKHSVELMTEEVKKYLPFFSEEQVSEL